MELTILLPVYNDWPAAAIVCKALGQALEGRSATPVRILLVDDGSTPPPAAGWLTGPLGAVQSVAILTLRRNLGHQRAIAVGLAYLHDQRQSGAIVVMDSDGEDRPEDVPRLLDAFERAGGESLVFAERRRRFEGLTFKSAYLLFRMVHRVLTGRGVRIGNFSVLPAGCLANLVVQSALWSHYAATVVNARLPMTTIRLDRGARLSGTSRMNFVALVAHGLSAVSVFRETVANRALLGASAIVAIGLLSLAGMLVATFAGKAALPALAWLAVGFIGVGVVQVVVVVLIFTLATLASREQFNVLPIRDYAHFVKEYRMVTDARQ